MRRRLAAGLLIVLAPGLAACGQDDGPTAGDPGTDDPAPTTEVAPGDQYTSSWDPVVPDQAADPAAVEADYAAVLDAVAAATADDIDWSTAQVSTETFDDTVCVVKVERVGDDESTLGVDELRDELDGIASEAGFDDLAPESDPGGAVTFVAHDADDVLLEYRSKGQTTIAVRVPTVAEECSDTESGTD